MSEPRIKFGKAVPVWLQRATHRWARRLLPADWTLSLEMADVDELECKHGKGSRAISASLPEYLDAAIWMASDHAEGEEAFRVIAHEISHARYQGIIHIFEQAWDGRRKMERKDALRLISDEVERMIQRDVGLYFRIWKR